MTIAELALRFGIVPSLPAMDRCAAPCPRDVARWYVLS
jgi:hypothetical protein